MNRILNLIGLAQKAGKASHGAEAVRKSIRAGKANLLVISNDIADHTRQEILQAAGKMKIPWIIAEDKYELGKSVGKAYRVAVTINDFGLAQRIIKEHKTAGNEANSMGVV